MRYSDKTDRKYFYLKGAFERDEYFKCQNDPLYFINTYIQIPHPVKGKIPFYIYMFQASLIYMWLQYKNTVTLKPRQMGVSTLVCAYALWLALFHGYKFITMISIKESIAKAMLRKVKIMYMNLPDFFKMEIINGTPGEVGSANRMAFKNGSEITASAATENAGRSESLSLLIMDEVAFQRYASSIWASAQPTLSTGGQAILLSSAFGIGTFFHQTYMDAVTRANNFFPIRLKWEMHPERSQGWYLQQLAALGAKRVAQEIDCDFLNSGYNVFDMAKIRAIEDRLQEVPPKEEFENKRLKMYFSAVPGKRYFIGADIAKGNARDFSAFSIMDAQGKEYACFKGKIGVREFAYMLMKWGKIYNNALLAPESNAIGEGVISILQDSSYPNIHTMQSTSKRVGEYDYRQSDTYGWLTTGKSRNEIITNMDDDLHDDSVELYNPFFVNEAYTFVYSGINNKPMALGKDSGGRNAMGSMYEDENSGAMYTDDSILAASITNTVRRTPIVNNDYMPLYGG